MRLSPGLDRPVRCAARGHARPSAARAAAGLRAGGDEAASCPDLTPPGGWAPLGDARGIARVVPKYPVSQAGFEPATDVLTTLLYQLSYKEKESKFPAGEVNLPHAVSRACAPGSARRTHEARRLSRRQLRIAEWHGTYCKRRARTAENADLFSCC